MAQFRPNIFVIHPMRGFVCFRMSTIERSSTIQPKQNGTIGSASGLLCISTIISGFEKTLTYRRYQRILCSTAPALFTRRK